MHPLGIPRESLSGTVGIICEDSVGEVVLAEELPDVFDRVQLRRVGRQRQQADVLRHLEFAAGLMPAGAVQRKDGVRARGHLGADLGQMQVHRLGVDERQHEGGADPPGGTDGAEQIGPAVTLIARCARAATLVRPDVGQAALLSDPGLILPP